MKKYFLFLLLIAGIKISAQEKILTPESCVLGFQQGFYPERLTQLGWIKGTDQYYYIHTIDGVETLVYGNGNGKGSEKKIIDLNELNDLLVAFNATSIGKQKSFPTIIWQSSTLFSFVIEKSKFHYNTSSKKLDMKSIYQLPTTSKNSDENAVTGNTAYTILNNLYVHFPSNDGTSDIMVTNDKDTNIVNGRSVHREEFGISKGTFWSPNGNLLAFYRMDQTMVTDYPILDLTVQPAQAHMIKYPMAGGVSHQVTVGVFNVAMGKTVFLKTTGEKDHYLTNIAWSPDNKFVYIAELNRDQNHLQLNRYNAATGDLDKTLFEETDPKYVHPMHPLQFVPGHADEFIWQRELCSAENPNGLNSILLFNTDGKLIKPLSYVLGAELQLVPNILFNVTDVYGFDATGSVLYFQAAQAGTCDKNVYSTSLSSDGIVWRDNNRQGTHSAIFSDDKKYFIDTYSSPTVPGIQSIYDNAGKEIKILLTAANPLTMVDPTSNGSNMITAKPCPVKLFQITAADNETKLWCRMILPAGFDSTKKYKSLTYVYNGPNVQLVTNSWLGGADLFLYYMAQQGFIVFTVDGRGSDNRGMKFEQATFQHLGTQEINDQEKGNQYLRSLKYVDGDHMAVYGWSYGGFMTTSLMTRKPDLYKCGVAGGPVIDWSYYEVMYTERYMDTPQTNPVGYKEACLVNYAGNLKGKLLQIHGTSDDVVVWQNSLLFQKACVSKNIQCDYFVYPGHMHNVKGKDRINLLTKVSEYIISNT